LSTRTVLYCTEQAIISRASQTTLQFNQKPTVVCGSPHNGRHCHAVGGVQRGRRPVGTGRVEIDSSEKLRMSRFDPLVVDPHSDALSIIAFLPDGDDLDVRKYPVLRRVQGVGKVVSGCRARGLGKGFGNLAVMEAFRPDQILVGLAADVLRRLETQSVGRAPEAAVLDAAVAIEVKGFAIDRRRSECNVGNVSGSRSNIRGGRGNILGGFRGVAVIVAPAATMNATIGGFGGGFLCRCHELLARRKISNEGDGPKHQRRTMP
jgi:hypothetical protein